MKKANQKSKLLVLYDFLFENTDSEHPVSVKEMIDYLSLQGISAERKSIYSDLETLTQFGLPIEKVKKKSTGYYVEDRKFEYAELILLADAVQSSRFITQKKSEELIKKLKSLTNKYQGKKLQRKVFVSNRVKAMNESIYYNVDGIADAIANDFRISFSYFTWNLKKEREFRHGGKDYCIIPIDLIWNNDNFYLVGFDESEGIKKHFRVDKMLKIRNAGKLTKEESEKFKGITDDYSEKVFGMFGGRTEKVRMRCDESLAGVFIDRFGKDLVFLKTDDGFETSFNVEISPVFLSWIAGFGKKAKIISPKSVVEEYKSLLTESLERYREE